MSAEKALQTGFDDARVFTVADTHQTFDKHAFQFDLGFDVHLDLVGNWQKQQVGGANAVNGGNKGSGTLPP